MSGKREFKADRRAWLIISRREAEAFEAAAHYVMQHELPSADLARALRVVQLQLSWIEHGLPLEGEPSKAAAVEREASA